MKVKRQKVCIQGLGFVGAAMAIAVASARDPAGTLLYDVVGVELDTPQGRDRCAAINAGQFPFATSDVRLVAYLEQAHLAGNLRASTEEIEYRDAVVTVVDVHLDVDLDSGAVDFTGFKSAINTLGRGLEPGAMVIIETTVPPGTTEKVAAPILAACLVERGLSGDAIHLAHSYERVMPGPDYFDSIVRMDRVYSATTPTAADRCRSFLASVIDTSAASLTQLASPAASETAKVMENTFRAVTIALMDEWGRFAEKLGINMFEVVDAIRRRPTHANIRQPGLGVGGYCLTKDPIFGPAASNLHGMIGIDFPMSRLAVQINREMPAHTVGLLEENLGSAMAGRRVLLCGIAYRSDVDDTRNAPSELLVRLLQKNGVEVQLHDPYVRYWPELRREVDDILPAPDDLDAVVLAVSHRHYRTDSFLAWLKGNRALVLDANNVMTSMQVSALQAANVPFLALGRGDIKL
jgi:nucleotide sugar dehydrogenase